MSTVKDIGIVLRVRPFSETSCVATLFTRQTGKVTGLAKGARRPKSSFDAALDLLAICRIVFIHKRTQSLDVLTEARLERRFHAASRELTRLYAAYYVAELLDTLTTEADPSSTLFDEATRVLTALDTDGEVFREVLRFELATLRILGHLPALHHCVECTRTVRMYRRVAFGPISGGVLCERCKVGKRQVIGVSAEVLQLLSQFADEGDISWKQVSMQSRFRGELRGVLNHYFSHIMGRRSRMYKFLGVLAE